MLNMSITYFKPSILSSRKVNSRNTTQILMTVALLFSTMMLSIYSSATAKDQLGKGYEFEGNGKRPGQCNLPAYSPVTQMDERRVFLGDFKWQLDQAIKNQLKRWKAETPKPWSNKTVALTADSLETVSRQILALQDGFNLGELQQQFSLQLLAGEDGCANTHFTGYFTPILRVSSKRQGKYIYPLYRKPLRWAGNTPLTRQQIDFKYGLANQGLELAYAADPISVYFLHVQGSGYAEFVDLGKRQTLQYAGKNGLGYKSIGRHLVETGAIPADKISLESIRSYLQKYPDKQEKIFSHNPSYTFFDLLNKKPMGSQGTEVVAGVSIAVDPKFIPLGSILLAEIPVLDEELKVEDYQYRLLVAQDTGAAIKGIGHVDLYQGAGVSAAEAAGSLHHYGRLWLITPNSL